MSLVQGKCKKGFTPNLFRGSGVLKFFSNDFLFYRGLFLLAFLFLSSCSNDDSKSSSRSGNVDTTKDICPAGKVLSEGSSEPCRLPEKGHYADGGEEKACTDISNKGDWSDTPEGGLAEDKCPFTCKSGYVQDESERACKTPPTGKYGDAQGAEQACTGNITNGTLGGQAVSVTRANACPFTCKSGYVQDESGRACNLPSQGKYGDAQGAEQPCTGNIENGNLGGQAVSVTDATACPFTCTSGYVKDGTLRTCNLPSQGKYADADGVEQPCQGGNITNGTLGGQAVSVTDATACPFTCKSGYVKDGTLRACNLPPKGKYADTQGVAQDCTAISGAQNSFDDWEQSTTPVASATACPFTCESGYVKSGRACNFPSKGKYVNAKGKEKPCSPIDDSAWSANTGPLNSDACPFTCTGGKTKGSSSRTCDDPSLGFWYNSGTKTACNPISHRKAWLPSQTALTTDACDFTCKAGYKKVNSGGTRACQVPAPGKYIKTNGTEGNCTPITNKLAWVEGPADSATACDFTCTAGYEKHERKCRTPLPGHYADNGTAEDCTPIANSIWATNTAPVTTKTACAFDCKAGFTKASGANPSCTLSSGHFIAGDGTAKPCGTAPDSSTGWAPDQSVDQKSNCVFQCATGREVSGTGEGGSAPWRGVILRRLSTG